MAKFILALIGLCVFLFSVLASLAGVIGGVLLLIAGDWLLLVFLILEAVIATFAISILILPVAIFIRPANSLQKIGYHFFAKVTDWMASLYLGLLFAIWSAYIFTFVMEYTETFWGGVFASFGTAIAPIAFISSKEFVGTKFASFKQTLFMLNAKIALLIMIVQGVLDDGSFFEAGAFYFIAYAVLSALGILMLSMAFKVPQV